MKLIQRIHRLLVNLKQRTFRLFSLIVVCLAALFGLNPSVNAATWYVDGGVMDCDNLGNSWPNAFKYLQDALNNLDLALGDQIWVKAGEYFVDQSCADELGSGDRAETFQLVKDVFLLGGFNGTEFDADERDPVENITILRGAIAQGQDPPPCAANMESCFQVHGPGGCLFEIDPQCCERVCDPVHGDVSCCLVQWDQQCVDAALDLCGGSYHVVTADSEIDDPEKTVIDGFELREGTANGTGFLEDQGGGMLIRGRPSVVRCTLTSNAASNRGAGMSIRSGAPDIINCVFDDNPGDPATPGDDQLFPDNGGGLASFGGNPRLVNCLFVDNAADFDGGAIHHSAAVGAQTFERITLINCTVYGNTAGPNSSGGGLYNSGGGSIFDIDSCIFWDNSPDQIEGSFLDSHVDYSDVEGGSPVGGTGNIDDDPLFVDAANGDYRLTILSLCIDAGNPLESIIPCDFFDLDIDDRACLPPDDERTPDLDLINRVLDGDDNNEAIVDMGSYEFIHPNVCPCADICPWDLDGNCDVGIGDLLIVLADWGNPYGIGDLLALLLAWGNCPCEPGPGPLTLEEELADACLTQENWDDFVSVMQTGSEAEKENWMCWMTHYLFHCNKCTCEHLPSECPGPDPF